MPEKIIDNRVIYRMSNAGRCPRALSAERLGYIPTPAPPWLETAANEGKLHENWIVNQLEAEGYNIGGRQAEMILEYPQFKLVGHIDGVAIKDNRQYLLEIKTMSHFEFQRWMKETFLGFNAYADQVSLYWQALKQQMTLAGALYVVKNRSSGYVDQFIMPQAPSDFELVISKLMAIEASVANDVLYEADFDPSSIECKRCNFRDQICLVNKEQLDPATEEVLIKATDMCREGKALIKQGENFFKEGRDILANHVEAVSPDKKYILNVNNMNIARFNVKRVSYPKDAIESAFAPEIYKPLQKVSEYWQTNITDLRKVEENGE